MTTFICSKDFKKGKKILALGDEVQIASVCYIVDGLSLSLKYGVDDNDVIFEILGIEDKTEFCKAHYGYFPVWHYGFPRPKRGDYEALTRVVVALMKISEAKTFWSEITHLFNFFKKKKD